MWKSLAAGNAIDEQTKDRKAETEQPPFTPPWMRTVTAQPQKNSDDSDDEADLDADDNQPAPVQEDDYFESGGEEEYD